MRNKLVVLVDWFIGMLMDFRCWLLHEIYRSQESKEILERWKKQHPETFGKKSVDPLKNDIFENIISSIEELKTRYTELERVSKIKDKTKDLEAAKVMSNFDKAIAFAEQDALSLKRE